MTVKDMNADSKEFLQSAKKEDEKSEKKDKE